MPPPPPRSSGAPARWPTARGRRASGVAAAPRASRLRRAAGAPPARSEARARGARFKRPREDLVVVWWVVRALRRNYLRLAPQNLGEYLPAYSLGSAAADRGRGRIVVSAHAYLGTLVMVGMNKKNYSPPLNAIKELYYSKLRGKGHKMEEEPESCDEE